MGGPSGPTLLFPIATNPCRGGPKSVGAEAPPTRDFGAEASRAKNESSPGDCRTYSLKRK
ncbi:DUF6053 domain-containing protein [Lysobacter capsici]|uniref:DUF6053 domain-containing protein n=1 Tax=Lysobacter capsici TaxID=435897 RepID=UPI003D2F7F82